MLKRIDFAHQLQLSKWRMGLLVGLLLLDGWIIMLPSRASADPSDEGEVLAEVQGPGPAGEFISCVVPEWYCSGTDVLVPPVECRGVQIHKDTSATRCSTCASEYVFPRPESWICPTKQDEGQKDGSGKAGVERNYYYFDYDQGTLINVPPYGFGVGGPTAL